MAMQGDPSDAGGIPSQVTEVKVRKKAVDPSPILTDNEDLVYKRCLVTNDTVEEALLTDKELEKKILVRAKEKFVGALRQDRIADKLRRDWRWQEAQRKKMEVGVRRPQDEPAVDG